MGLAKNCEYPGSCPYKDTDDKISKKINDKTLMNTKPAVKTSKLINHLAFTVAPMD